MPNKNSDWLVHQWIIAGFVASAARFLPLPLVDEFVRQQCYRFVVSQTLAAAETDSSVSDWKPYYANSGGCMTGCVGSVALLPVKLLLFPIRKLISIFGHVRGVPLDITRSVLLGRTLHRRLESGAHDPAEALPMRLAFEEAFSRIDLHVARAAIADAIKGISGWKAATLEAARRVRTGAADPKEIESDPSIKEAANRVEEVLEQAEMIKLFESFDRRFDEAFSRQIARPNR